MQGNPWDDIGTIRTFYEGFKWYHPYIQPDRFQDTLLNNCEMANRDLVMAYEREMGYK